LLNAWISIVVAMVHNDGELPNEADLYRYALIFEEKDKQSLSKALAKFKKSGLIKEVNDLIYKQKELRQKRQDAGRKGGMKSTKKQAKGKQSDPESESEPKTEIESKSESEKKEDSKGDFLYLKKDSGLDFDIRNTLTPELDTYARDTASILNLDFLMLIEKYNTLVRRNPPKFPNKAFMAWLESYTKPIIEKRNRR